MTHQVRPAGPDDAGVARRLLLACNPEADEPAPPVLAQRARVTAARRRQERLGSSNRSGRDGPLLPARERER